MKALPVVLKVTEAYSIKKKFSKISKANKNVADDFYKYLLINFFS